ncbi:hypothetical protein [uncultured Kordia sp.]|uniref:hypothetical protein n=1 Tax=uncultured Kordia sp. TaxID=507699 RepID=UPI00261D75B1|nr:hypothetical protein [uncultured Kordia sp.]
MKKRQFQKKLKLTKVIVTDLNSLKGGRAGTHYEWCENGGSNFPCEVGKDR